MNPSLPMPLDVRLINATTAVLLAVFAVLLAGAAMAWALRAPWFSIAGIVVTGEVSHNNALTLKANVAPRLVGSFFTMDLTRARQVFESVPWVRKAVVRREFPNRLHVNLKEHQAVALWGPETEPRLVNSFGEVFEANVDEVEQENLPRLLGPEGQAAQVLAAYQALQPLFESLDMVLEQLELSGRGGWVSRLDTGAVIQLGRGNVDEVRARTVRFLATLGRVTDQHGRKPESLESADLRHESGYAIRLRGVTTTISPAPKK
jgi:cell division protein FtsQ